MSSEKLFHPSFPNSKAINSRTFDEQDFIVSENDFLKLDAVRPLGLTGHMRVRNEEMTLEACLNSCLDFLDELIIVYNDSWDNTEKILLEYAQKYPQKIRLFWYPLEIVNKTKYNMQNAAYTLSIEDNNEQLLMPLFNLANFYNFGYVKTSYSHYMKIDADQVYFSEKMLHIKQCILNNCDAADENDYLQEAINTYKNKHPRKNEFYSLSGINIILGKNGLSVPIGTSSTISLFNGETDHFIVSPNSNDRYYHTEQYEIFTRNEKVVINLGLCWIHTGFVKRRATRTHDSEIQLYLIRTLEWQQILPNINLTNKPLSWLNNEFFWNRDVKKYFTQEFYDKYMPSIEKYAQKHFAKQYKKTIYLHLGEHKTGTTAIQRSLEDLQNRELLKNHGYFFIWKGLYQLVNSSRYIPSGEEPLARLCSYLEKSLQSNEEHNIIISCEAFCTNEFFISTNIEKLAKIFSKYHVKILIYLRRQDKYIESLWAQNMKFLGSSQTPSLKTPAPRWKELLEIYSKFFGKDNITVRVYDRQTLYLNNSISDFFQWVGLLPLIPQLSTGLYSNPSLSPTNLRIRLAFMKRNMLTLEQKHLYLEKLNAELLQVENEIPWHIANELERVQAGVNVSRHFLASLNQLLACEKTPQVNTNNYLTLEDRTQYLEKFKAENIFIAKNYMNKEDGVLFSDDMPSETISLDSPTTEDLVATFLPIMVSFEQTFDKLFDQNKKRLSYTEQQGLSIKELFESIASHKQNIFNIDNAVQEHGLVLRDVASKIENLENNLQLQNDAIAQQNASLKNIQATINLMQNKLNEHNRALAQQNHFKRSIHKKIATLEKNINLHNNRLTQLRKDNSIKLSKISSVINSIFQPFIKKKAFSLCNGGRISEAERIVLNVILNNPSISWAYYILAKCQCAQGIYTLALENVQIAIDLDPQVEFYSKYKRNILLKRKNSKHKLRAS